MPPPLQTPYLRAAFITGPLVAAASLLLGAIGVLLARGLDGASIGVVLRSGAHVWLVAVGSGLRADGVTLSIVPIGAVLVAVGVGARVTRWTVPDPVDDLPAFVASTGAVHGAVAALAAAVSGTGSIEISPVRAAAAGFVVGALSAAIGAVSRHGGAEALWFTISEDLRRAVRASVWGVAALLASAAVLVVWQLLTHLDRAADLWALLDPGSGGGLALALASLLAVPNLVLWTVAVLIGPGFALGTGTSVDLAGAQLGAVPGFPLLAALPSPGAFGGWVFVLGLLPLLAGAVAGWHADAGGREGATARLLAGVAAGGVAGFVIGVLVGASGGAIGPGRMAEAGPPALTPLLIAVPVMALGGALGALLAHYREARADPAQRLPGDDTDDAAPPREGRGPRLWRRHQPAGADRRVDPPADGG